MLGIMNAALLAQGELVITENDGSNEYQLLARNWPGIVEAELEDGAYYFTKTQAEIVTRTDGKYGFDDGYMVPSGALHVRRAWTLTTAGERQEVDWVQDSTYVYVDEDEGIWIEYVSVPGVDLWSANFTMGVQKRLEACISRAIKEEFSEAELLDKAAEVYFQRARTNSSKARTSTPPYKKGPIALARNGRG